MDIARRRVDFRSWIEAFGRAGDDGGREIEPAMDLAVLVDVGLAETEAAHQVQDDILAGLHLEEDLFAHAFAPCGRHRGWRSAGGSFCRLVMSGTIVAQVAERCRAPR